MESDPLEEFLTGINPKFGEYAEKLREQGMSSVDELDMLGDDDYKTLGIPMFHWKKIMKKVKKANAPPEPEVKEEPEPAEEPGAAGEGTTSPFADDSLGGGYSKAGASKVAKSFDDASVKARLIHFYKLYNPEKVGDEAAVDALLKQYAGNTSQLFADLERKYILGSREKTYKRKKLAPKITKTDVVTDGLARMYAERIRNLEETYEFPKFHTPLLNNVDFHAKPIVLLVGQYSVGKTSFIKFLIERDFPGMRIGPEPTTDCFACIMHGMEERVIPGNAAVMDANKPFRTLTRFGMGFMNKFNVSEVPAPLLETITFVDSPGILSGEKQRIGRNYDFPKVVEWFAYKSDRILLLFDAHKLDISDELRLALDCLKGHDDKVRVVLNKADMVTNQQLLRVYGALMWSLGKVFKTPEVLRVYVGSYWDRDYQNLHNAELFDAEANDLLSDLRGLPRHSAMRKINEFVKRTRRLKVHLLILDHLKKQFGWFSKGKTQQKLLANLAEQFRQIAKEHNLNLRSDFPNPTRFREVIGQFDLSKFPKMKPKFIESLTDILEKDIPKLMESLPSMTVSSGDDEEGDAANPFALMESGTDAALSGAKGWVVNSTDKARFDVDFHKLSLVGGKASGQQVMVVMQKSGLSRDTLKKIWDLSDIDRDGKMDHEEFALCNYLIQMVQNGNAIPPTLPIRLVPPGKRKLLEFN